MPACVLAFLFAGVPTVRTQQPPATPPAKPPAASVPAAPGAPEKPAEKPADPNARQFSTTAGVIFNLIKPDKAADFEAVLTRVKEALTASKNETRKQQALGWRVYRSPDPGPGGNVLYLFLFDPAVKNEDYSVTKILQEAFPTEVQDLYAKLIACYADNGQSLMNLELRLNMAPTAVGK